MRSSPAWSGTSVRKPLTSSTMWRKYVQSFSFPLVIFPARLTGLFMLLCQCRSSNHLQRQGAKIKVSENHPLLGPAFSDPPEPRVCVCLCVCE